MFALPSPIQQCNEGLSSYNKTIKINKKHQSEREKYNHFY